MTQTEAANVLRARWAELWLLPPAERRIRIDEILRGTVAERADPPQVFELVR